MDRAGVEIAHNGVRSDDDVKATGARAVSNGGTSRLQPGGILHEDTPYKMGENIFDCRDRRGAVGWDGIHAAECLRGWHDQERGRGPVDFFGNGYSWWVRGGGKRVSEWREFQEQLRDRQRSYLYQRGNPEGQPIRDQQRML